MAKFPLDPKLGDIALLSQEKRYKYVNKKKTDTILGVNVVGMPLGELADILGGERPIKIKLPNEKINFKKLEEVQMINFTLTPYKLPENRHVRYSFSADGFRPVDSDGMSSEGDVK